MLRALTLVVLATCLLASGPADAHVGGIERAAFETPQIPTPSTVAGPPHVLVAGGRADRPWPIIVVIALLAAVALIRRRRSCRLVAAILVVLIGVLAFETALHSVHHGLADEQMACSVASVAAHVHGTMSGLPATDAPILRAVFTLAPSKPLFRPQPQADSQHDRAPPSALA